MTRCTAILVTALVVSSLPAQVTAQTWPGLATAGLPTVYVLDDGGVETSAWTLTRSCFWLATPNDVSMPLG
jgi:hypothetical protein